MADTLIVGRTIGVTALAGVGSTGSLLFLVLGFVMGMTSGFSIVTAQFFGACNKVGVRRSFCAGILLSAVVAAVLTISRVLLSHTVLVLMLTPPEIMEDAHSYIIVISWGIGAAVLLGGLIAEISSFDDAFILGLIMLFFSAVLYMKVIGPQYEKNRLR